MWFSVDRIEDKRTVVLVGDDNTVCHLSVEAYTAYTGIQPAEAQMLCCDTQNGRIVSAHYDPDETERRQISARERLHRLFNKKQS